jgi:hypothetical protein
MVGPGEVAGTSSIKSLLEGAGEMGHLMRKGYFRRRPHPDCSFYETEVRAGYTRDAKAAHTRASLSGNREPADQRNHIRSVSGRFDAADRA